MKTLITGATGFIGRHLVQDDCLAMVRKPSGFHKEVIADLLDKESLAAACSGIETIIHCAGFARDTGDRNETLHWQINFEGTKNILAAAQEAKVKKFIFLSTVKAMAKPGSYCVNEDWPGEPTSHYGRAKKAAEREVINAGKSGSIQVIILRPTMVYGPGGSSNLERLAKGIRAGWFPILPDTKNRRSYLNINDLTNAIWMAAKQADANGKTYIVADPRPYSGREVCDIILSLSPKPKIYWQASEKYFRYLGRLGDLFERFLMRSFPVHSEIISRLLDSECYCPLRIQNELGWQPKIGLKEGLNTLLRNSAGKQ